MEGIEFEKENYGKPIGLRTAPRQSWAVKLVRKIGGQYVKSDEQASLILIVVVAIFFILTIYNFATAGKTPRASQAERERTDRLMQQQLQAAKNR